MAFELRCPFFEDLFAACALMASDSGTVVNVNDAVDKCVVQAESSSKVGRCLKRVVADDSH